MTSVGRFDVVVIGAGAAGMMCAATAGQRGRNVLLIEHYDKLGEKIRISGGGRCNFTNLHADPANYLSQNPDFCRSALARYTPRDFVALVERHGIAWHEKKLGQLFCDETALDIIAMLRTECERGQVQWRMPCSVDAIDHADGTFRIATSQGPVVTSAVVIATGGLTVPKIGATPFGYRIAEQFGLAVVAPRPALVPLALDAVALAHYGDLSGVSVEAEVTCREGRFRENVLFTHRGLSGPAILQISSYWHGGDPIHIDLLPGVAAAECLQCRATVGDASRYAACGTIADAEAARTPVVRGARCSATVAATGRQAHRRTGGSAARLAGIAFGNARLQQGRGHDRGCRYA